MATTIMISTSVNPFRDDLTFIVNLSFARRGRGSRRITINTKIVHELPAANRGMSVAWRPYSRQRRNWDNGPRTTDTEARP